ncbi:MAG: cysteine--tRNA ligase, partial [Pseudomonadota bacterium]|nr:cysteine--tRNA ligase [Pseudomonadota bacterium]
WMHNGFVQVEGRKMAKSEGNFVTIHDLLHTENFGGRKWPGEVLRLAMLMTHYREPIDFSVKRLDEADARLSKWYGFLKKTLFTRYQYDRASIASAISAGKKANASLNGFGPSLIFDDLSLNVLFTYFDGTVKDFNSGADIGFNRQLNFLYLLELCGLASVQALVSLDPSGDVDAESTEMEITHRLALLAEKNFAEADKIRDELAAQGIQLMDYKDPETGERRTKWEVKR